MCSVACVWPESTKYNWSPNWCSSSSCLQEPGTLLCGFTCDPSPGRVQKARMGGRWRGNHFPSTSIPVLRRLALKGAYLYVFMSIRRNDMSAPNIHSNNPVFCSASQFAKPFNLPLVHVMSLSRAREARELCSGEHRLRAARAWVLSLL